MLLHFCHFFLQGSNFLLELNDAVTLLGVLQIRLRHFLPFERELLLVFDLHLSDLLVILLRQCRLLLAYFALQLALVLLLQLLANVSMQLLRHLCLLLHFFIDHLAFVLRERGFVLFFLLLDELILFYLKLFLRLFLALLELALELSAPKFEFLCQYLFDLVDLSLDEAPSFAVHLLKVFLFFSISLSMHFFNLH